MKCLGFSAQLRPPSAANQKSLIWNRFWASFDTAFSRIGQDISETFRPVHLNLWYRWFIGEFSEQNIQMILGQIDWSYSHVRERKSVGGRALKIPGSYIDMLEDLVLKLVWTTLRSLQNTGPMGYILRHFWHWITPKYVNNEIFVHFVHMFLLLSQDTCF